MKILVLNSGSSSLKFKVYSAPELHPLASGIIEEIGARGGRGRLSIFSDANFHVVIDELVTCPSHRDALAKMSHFLKRSGIIKDIKELFAIGHRVVHGGEHFKEPVIIDDEVISTIKEIVPLAPLHNPANLAGIEVALEHAPGVPQVAVFDTAFHQTIPEHAYLYAIPREYYSKYGIRRYGFHGTSHSYVMKRAIEYLDGRKERARLITIHLGNGASMAAIKGGACVDTSMGFTPLEGLIMGTRCGDMDPAIILYLEREHGMKPDEIDTVLNKASGLSGICGESDMRIIEKRARAGDKAALLALKMFSYRIKKYIGAYCAALGGVDAICFTGGIGENSSLVRRDCLIGLSFLGIELDDEKNRSLAHPQKGVYEISPEGNSVKVLVVPTDEEREIAQQTLEVINEKPATK